MEKIKHNFKKFLSFLFIILGFYLFIAYIYLNFIRERIPRDIPFKLTEFTFYLLICILIVYLYAIKKYIFPKPPKLFFIKLLSVIFTPFVFFDAFAKQNKIIYPYYYKLFCFMAKSFEESFIIKDKLLLSRIFNLFPRIILLSIFAIDVFYLHKIEIFYYFIFLGIFPLIYRYYIYSIEFALEQYIKLLESKYDSVLIIEKGNYRMNNIYVYDDLEDETVYGKHNPKAVYHDECVSIREYIKIQAEIIIDNEKNNEETIFEYSGQPYSKEEVYKQYRKNNNKINCHLDNDDYNRLHQLFDMLESPLINFYIYLFLTKKIQELTFIKQFKLFISIIYFIIWIYILLISIHTLKDLSLTLKLLEIIKEYSVMEEPFSQLIIKPIVNYYEKFL